MKKGFTLLEIVFALAIAASSVLILAGLFSWSLKSTQEEQIYSAAALISENLHSRLQSDVDWPVPQNQTLAYTNGTYQTNFYYNLEGNETESSSAIFRSEIHFVKPDAAHYASTRLDLMRIDFYELKNNRLIMRNYLQRAHSKPRL